MSSLNIFGTTIEFKSFRVNNILRSMFPFFRLTEQIAAVFFLLERLKEWQGLLPRE